MFTTSRLSLWLALLLIAVFFSGCARTPTPPPTPEVPSNITQIEPSRDIPDFTLTNQAGRTTHRHDLEGKFVLLSFGYTHCPDVCPITLAHFKQVKGLLEDKADQVTFVFISVDGARDTPERLSEYVPMFDPEFVGLTSDEVTVRAVITQFGGLFNIQNAGGLRKDYLVEHSTPYYLLDRQGKWVRKYAYASTPEEVSADILALIG
jgi:protein SCO1/2